MEKREIEQDGGGLGVLMVLEGFPHTSPIPEFLGSASALISRTSFYPFSSAFFP